MTSVNQDFQSAPAGRRVVVTMIAVFFGLFGAIAVNAAFAFKALHAHSSPANRTAAVLAPLVGLLVVLPVFLFQRSRIARFRIEENCLVLGRKRYPLEGLVDVARDPGILRWAFKIAGNRSEEHTSELQSLRHLVCRLLLEKKKTNRVDLERCKSNKAAAEQYAPSRTY